MGQCRVRTIMSSTEVFHRVGGGVGKHSQAAQIGGGGMVRMTLAAVSPLLGRG